MAKKKGSLKKTGRKKRLIKHPHIKKISRKSIPEDKQVKHSPADKYLLAGVILITLIAFLRLFLGHSVFKIDFGRYNVQISFIRSSPAFYVVIGLIALIIIIILYNILRSKSKRMKKEKPKQAGVEAEAVRRKKPTKKISEKKAAHKKISGESKSTGVSYFVLFLLSIILFSAAYFYKNMLTMALALVLMFLSLLGYRKLKHPKIPIPPKLPGKKKKKQLAKKSRIDFKSIFSKLSKWKPKKEKAAPAKESLKLKKIELGKYETHLDALYRIVEKKGKVKLSVLSEYFGIDKKKIEEWAVILEQHELLKLHYPAIGEPELIKIDAKDIAERGMEVKPMR